MSKYFNTKVKVLQPYNRREYEALQRALYAQGCKWHGRQSKIILADDPDAYGILIDREGVMVWCHSANEYNSWPAPDLSYDITTEITLGPIPRESIVVDGKCYDKDELKQALSKLREVDY